jgi:hypothetical protein
MKKTTTILLAGMLIVAIAGIGMASAATDDTDGTTFFGQMSRWAGQCVRYANGYMNGYGYADCPVYGAYATDGATADIEVENIDDAITIAEDDTVKQGRIDAYTGEVIEDFYADTTYQDQYYQGGRVMRGGSYGGSDGCV